MDYSKILIALGVSAGLLIGAEIDPKFEPVRKLLNEKFNKNFEIIKAEPLSNALSVVVVESSGERGMFVIENNTQRIFNIEALVNEPNKANVEMLRRTYAELTAYNASKKENAILDSIKKNKGISFSLGENKKGQVTYMVLDSMCPYCKDKVDTIEEEMKKGKMEIIIVGFLGEESAKRANYFYKNIVNAKNDKAKIELLKKVFNKNIRIEDEEANKNAQEATQAVIDAGIDGVPYSFVR